MPSAQPPEKIGRYPIERLLGAGGMGVVYLARDPTLERPVAIKVLPGSLANQPAVMSRLEREAKALAAVNHPNIAVIHSLEADADGGRFLVMEYVEGDPLSVRIASRPLPYREAAGLALQIADALTAAHARGVVHRDLKPDNIMVTRDGRVKVLDFGLARRAELGPGEATLTATLPGAVMGTPGFMSPEQIRGERVDARADLFSFGCLLFELLSGHKAFLGTSLHDRIAATLRDDPPWTTLPADIPKEVRVLLKRCLEKDPAHRLHDTATVRAVLAASLDPAEGRPSAPTVTTRGLPPAFNAFIGRRHDVAEIGSLLTSHHLVTLTGAGGCGKTRLARETVDGLSAVASVVWAELAPLAAGDDILPAVFHALGLPQAGEGLDHLVVQFADQPTFLVLDNCEHVLDAAAALTTRLLADCPQVRVLATSRERFNVSGETVYPVSALSLPPGDTQVTAEEIAGSEAVALFLERARAGHPGFVLDDAVAPAVARICRRVDGLPLALELAAGRVKSLTPEQIADRLEQSFKLLSGGSRTALPHQQTMRQTVAWSYDQLIAEEQTLLKRLSVFVDGWDLEASEIVTAGEGLEESDIVLILSALVEKSLVVFDRHRERYRLLTAVRDFARERHQEEASETHRRMARHASHYLNLARETEPLLTGPKQAAAFARLAADRLNLEAAIRRGMTTLADPEQALALAGALWRFWWTRGYFQTGGAVYQELLATPTGRTPGPLRARALFGAGVLAWPMGDYARARRHLEESVALYRSIDQPADLADALNALGIVHGMEKNVDGARTAYEESLKIHENAGDRRKTAVALQNLGILAENSGDLESAAQYYQASLPLIREAGDERSLASLLLNLGKTLGKQGHAGQAASHYSECLPMYRELGDRHGIAAALLNLSTVSRESGQVDRAFGHIAEALQLIAETNDRHLLLTAWDELLHLAVVAKDDVWAARVLGAAETLRAELGTPRTPEEEAQITRATEPARASLGDGFAGHVSLGRRMTPGEARTWLLPKTETIIRS